MIDFLNQQSGDSKPKEDKADMDTQNVFAHILFKNKEISPTSLSSNILGTFPSDLRTLMEGPGPSSNEPHIILQVACSELFNNKYSQKKNRQNISSKLNEYEDDEFEENIDDTNEENLKDAIKNHFIKTERFKNMIIQLFEDFQEISETLIKEIIAKYCEEKKNKMKQNSDYFERLNKLYKAIKSEKENPEQIKINKEEEPEEDAEYCYLIFSDFVLIFVGIMKYFTRFNYYISFTDFKDHFLLHIWGDQNEYGKLAEKMNYELMLKHYAIKYNEAKLQKTKVKQPSIMNFDVVEEKKEELIPDKGENPVNSDGLPFKYSNLCFSNHLHWPPHIPFIQEKESRFQRYEINDEYHECPAQINEHEEDSNETCGKCSVFRNVDKLRIIFDTLDGLLKFNYLKKRKIITDIFVLRNYESYKKKLEFKPIVFHNWNIFSTPVQLDFIYTIRNYFCETMSYYFLWLTNYLIWMLIPSVFGLIIYIVAIAIPDSDKENNGDKFRSRDSFKIVFGGLTVIWGSMFLYQWKQKEEIYNYIWGTQNFKHNEPDREEFCADLIEELMFGKPFPFVSKLKMYTKFVISYLTLFVMVLITCALIILSFYVKKLLGDRDLEEKYSLYISMGVASINAIQIKVMNYFYCFLADKLNDWENHQKEFQRINSNNIKNIMFDFMNNYFACFYIAFIKTNIGMLNITWLTIDTNCYGYTGTSSYHCLEELEIQLYTTLGIFAAFNLMELGLPMAMQFLRYKRYCKAKEENGFGSISPKDIVRHSVEYQSLCDDYNDVSGEYGEMLILFGYVCLFGVAAPLVPFLAFLLAYLEKFVDSFKLCFLVRVSILDGSTGIEMYKQIMQTFIYIGLITNAAITCFTDKDLSDFQNLLNIFVSVIAGFFVLCFISKWNVFPRWFIYKDDFKDLYIAKCVDRDFSTTVKKMKKDIKY